MRKIALFAGCLVLLLSWPAYILYGELQKVQSDDPQVWEEDIRAFEALDATGQNPEQAVVFVGSSSIRFWASLAEDMAPVPVINRGFGGAKLNDVAHYARRLVSVHDPLAVVVFAGTNDIQPGNTKSPETLFASYRALVDTLRSDDDALPIYFIAITPSPLRWDVWPVALETNQLINDYAAAADGLYVIDTGSALLGDDGQPDPDNYRFDGLHLSDQGYAIWTRLIRPHVLPFAPGE
ncbi:MAG: GDSL-type esterase/lipase family protein [Pseudomonadota bacterium]